MSLTPAEMLVLRYMADGYRDREIAADLGISVHTVKDQVQGALRHLGARNRAHAVAQGYRTGMLDDILIRWDDGQVTRMHERV